MLQLVGNHGSACIFITLSEDMTNDHDKFKESRYLSLTDKLSLSPSKSYSHPRSISLDSTMHHYVVNIVCFYTYVG